MDQDRVLAEATTALRKGDRSAAARILEGALEREPGNAAYHDLLAGVFYMGGRSADALPHARRAAQLAPQVARFLRGEATILIALGRNEEALENLEKVLEMTPQDAEARNDLGATYVKVGNLGAAEAAFRQAIADGPADFAPYTNLDMVLARQDRLAEAEDMFRDLLARAPEDPDVLFHIGRASFRMNHMLTAEKALEEALEKRPDFVDAIALLAHVKARRGYFEDSLALMRRARSLDPKNARLLETTGKILLDCQRSRDAIKAYREALKIDPLSIDSLAQLSFFGKQDWGLDLCQAIEHARQVIGPEDTRSRIALDFAEARALDQLGRYQAAWNMALAANQECRTDHRFDESDETASLDALIAEMNDLASNAGQFPVQARDAPPFVLISGLIRSGKSTLEQLMSGLPGIKRGYEGNLFSETVEEMNARLGPQAAEDNVDPMMRHFTEFQEDLREKLAQKSKGCSAFTMTIYLQYLMRNIGNLLKMLPNAYVIFVNRDPLDNALRIFLSNYVFVDHSYSYRLSSIMRQIVLSRDLAEKCTKAAPERCMSVRYEDMVEDPASARARVADFCRLPVPDLPPKPVFDDRDCAAPYRELMEACLKEEGWTPAEALSPGKSSHG